MVWTIWCQTGFRSNLFDAGVGDRNIWEPSRYFLHHLQEEVAQARKYLHR